MENITEPEYESPPGSDPSSELEGGNANTAAAAPTVPDSADNTRTGIDAVERFAPVGAEQKDQNEDSSVSDPGPPSEVDALNARNFLVEETLLAALAYEPRPSDVFTVSYPKCGSALLQFLVFGVLNRGEPSKDFAEFVARAPYLEWVGIKSVLEMRRPGAIKTHLPFEKNPHSPHAKYIYMARNPFDCCASYYTHMRTMPLNRPESANFDVFFDAFLEGKVIYGDYFDHVLSWYDHRNDPNVLFITFEDVKSDPRTSTIRIADFVDPSIGRELRDDPVLLSNVLKIASANNMTTTCHQGLRSILADELSMTVGKEHITPAEFYKNVFAEALEIAEGSDFTRKPICGRWKEFFKPEHVQRMYEWIDQKTAGSDVFSIWSNSELPRPNSGKP
uniref:Sulfotransferase n=1 Tax=Rhipicephalus appendiculatus TaxID=34631 RepID=A0A131Z2V1_RHIAP